MGLQTTRRPRSVTAWRPHGDRRAVFVDDLEPICFGPVTKLKPEPEFSQPASGIG